MIEIRWAKEGEIERQKDMWKLCFGDRDTYIDFYFANKYKNNETLVLTYDQEIVSILTMMPIKATLPDKRILRSTMLYAIATHPDYRKRGFSTELINHAERLLIDTQHEFSILVPAGQHLFDFYRKQGYRIYFYLREVILPISILTPIPVKEPHNYSIIPLLPEEYNSRRNELLEGSLYIAYDEEEIGYQKQLSLYSGADIYGIEIYSKDTRSERRYGCAIVERRNTARVVIKELLLPEKEYLPVLKRLSELIPAREYVVRTPAHLSACLGGTVRPFGMIKSLSGKELGHYLQDQGYLGVAFD